MSSSESERSPRSEPQRIAAIQPALAPARVSSQVVRALNTTRALADPGYAHAIITTYVQTKMGRGKSTAQVNAKLLVLERDMPQFASDFYAVRKQFGLGDSAVLPVPTHRPSICRCGASRSGTDEPEDGARRMHPPPPAYPGRDGADYIGQ